MNTHTSIKNSLQQGIVLLNNTSDSATLDAEILLAYILKKPRSYLFAWPDKLLTENEIDEFQSLIALRNDGQPIAYLTGEKEFWSLRFKVTRDVLIPRPETELLVETALKLLPKQAIKVADLGTGSGAIAIALAHERPIWQITATDQSKAALAIAASNAANNKVNIDFKIGHWLEPLKSQKFHAIISNPPYIAPDDLHLLTDIRFEPKCALVAQDQGYAELAKIINDSGAYLFSNGYLLLEHGYDQAEKVFNLLIQRGFKNITSVQDLAGHTRMTYAQWQTD